MNTSRLLISAVAPFALLVFLVGCEPPKPPADGSEAIVPGSPALKPGDTIQKVGETDTRQYSDLRNQTSLDDGEDPVPPTSSRISADTIDTAAIQAAGAADATGPLAEIVTLVDSLGGRFTFDRDGTLRGIDIMESRTSADDAAVVKILDTLSLRSLKLSGLGITPKSLKLLADQQDLEELMLKDTQVTDDDLVMIAKLPKLSTLLLERCSKLTDAAIAPLVDAPNLSRLHLIDNTFSGDIMPTLVKIQGLVLLDLRKCGQIDAPALQTLPQFDSVTALRLAGGRIGDDVMPPVAGMPSLRSLTIEDAGPLTAEGIAKLADLPLVDISLRNCSMLTDDALAELAKIKTLRALMLRDGYFMKEGFDQLAGHPALETVRIHQMTIFDEAAQWLTTLPKAQRIDLCGTLITGETLEKLAAVGTLEHLYLDDGGLSDDDIARLAGAKMLKTLSLGKSDTGAANTSVTDMAVETLGALKSLTTLDLSGTSIGEDGAARLREALPGCKITK